VKIPAGWAPSPLRAPAAGSIRGRYRPGPTVRYRSFTDTSTSSRRSPRGCWAHDVKQPLSAPSSRLPLFADSALMRVGYARTPAPGLASCERIPLRDLALPHVDRIDGCTPGVGPIAAGWQRRARAVKGPKRARARAGRWPGRGVSMPLMARCSHDDGARAPA
jgi:hypothetical protein